eukprot:6991557-Pyramimonas_sp.AAC.1
MDLQDEHEMSVSSPPLWRPFETTRAPRARARQGAAAGSHPTAGNPPRTNGNDLQDEWPSLG